MDWYSRFITRFPWIPILIVWVISLTCAPIAFYFHLDDISDFTQYTKGLEPRGTEKNTWALSQAKLGELDYSRLPHRKFTRVSEESRRRRRASSDIDLKHNHTVSDIRENPEAYFADYWENGPVLLKPKSNDIYEEQTSSRKRQRRDGIIPLEECYKKDIVEKDLRRMVVETSTPGGDLLSPEALHAICQLENQYILPYADVYESDGCPPHSLPLYVGALNEVPCDQINQQHVDYFREIMKNCSEHYENGKLGDVCKVRSCREIPQECLKYSAVFKTLHYLADKEFPKLSPIITKALITLPQKKADVHPMLEYYLNVLDGAKLDNGVVKISGMNLGIKFDLFNNFLLGDMPFFGLAGAFIIVIMLIYLRSIALLIVTLINVMISFAVSYFLYFYVFQLKFYPFMNMFAGLILIAVGADDIFVLRDIWESKKWNSEGEKVPVEKMVHGTLKHGALSIFVTSLTTAAAFIANYVHKITAIRLFGIFAATCILVNFVFMITWVIGIMIIIEKIERRFNLEEWKCLIPIYNLCRKANKKVYEDFLPKFITKLAPAWVFIFTCIGTAGLILVFATPTLKLPSSEEFQVLQNDHPIEKYITDLKMDFRFESIILDAVDKLYLSMIWGIIGEDYGDWLDPDNTGTLRFNDNFDYFHPDSIIFLRDLCRDLMNTDLVGDPERYVCIFDAMESAAAGSCGRLKLLEDILKIKVESNCCEVAFPGSRELNEDCIINLLTEDLLFRMQSEEFYTSNSKVVGITMFDQNNTVKAFRYIFRTTMAPTNEYKPMKDFYGKVSDYMREKVEDSPPEMDGGWFSGVHELTFLMLDLQESMATGALLGIGLSLGIGFIVLVITSPNVILSIYAIISIGLTIAITVGSLAVMGWELNIVESVTITLAVGLSIDFTIHYSVAYRISAEIPRRLKVHDAIRSVGSAVSMGALTTFLAGVAVMPGRLLIYTRFGIFLMLVMATSWVFSNFFFLSLCSIVGPEGNVGEMLAPCKQRKDGDPKGNDKRESHADSGFRGLKHALYQEHIAAFFLNPNPSTPLSADSISADYSTSKSEQISQSHQSAYISRDTLEIPISKERPQSWNPFSVPLSLNNKMSLAGSQSHTRINTGVSPRKRQNKEGNRIADQASTASIDRSSSFFFSRLGIPRFMRYNTNSIWGSASYLPSSLPSSRSGIIDSMYYNQSDSIDPENEHDFFHIKNSSITPKSTEPEPEKEAITANVTSGIHNPGDIVHKVNIDIH